MAKVWCERVCSQLRNSSLRGGALSSERQITTANAGATVLVTTAASVVLPMPPMPKIEISCAGTPPVAGSVNQAVNCATSARRSTKKSTMGISAQSRRGDADLWSDVTG